jgi:hypothetical protein
MNAERYIVARKDTKEQLGLYVDLSIAARKVKYWQKKLRTEIYIVVSKINER